MTRSRPRPSPWAADPTILDTYERPRPRHRREAMPDYEAIQITQHADGTVHVDTAPLPEHIEISRELWEQIRDDNDGADGPRYAWLETIQHADPDRDNDGYMFHIDADNVHCSYRIASIPDEGPIRATLGGWVEK